MNHVSPLTLEIFFHIYTTPSELPRWESQGTKETVKWLIENELITWNPPGPITTAGHHNYTLTRKGEIWKAAILSVPLPVLQYVMPHPYPQP